MPIYEYKCNRCLLQFELKRRINEDGSGFCPRCGSEAYRLFSPAPIIFKGSGFYVTDNRKAQNSFSDKNDGGTTKSENEAETKKP